MSDAICQETWRPVVGFETFYEVSDRGRVRSCPRLAYAGRGHTRKVRPTVLSAYVGDHYSKVRLKVNGGGITKNVHQLVAEAFLGPRPDGMEVCHNNGAHHDNRVENLRYDTHSANQYDNVRLGRNRMASRTHCNNGHEFTPENTCPRVGDNESGRRCRTCERERSKRRVERKRGERAA